MSSDAARPPVSSYDLPCGQVLIYAPSKSVRGKLAEIDLKIRNEGYLEEVLGRDFFAVAALGVIAEGCTSIEEVIHPPPGASLDPDDPLRWQPFNEFRRCDYELRRVGLAMVEAIIETWDPTDPITVYQQGFARECLWRVQQDDEWEEALIASIRGKPRPDLAEIAAEAGRAAAIYRPPIPPDFYASDPAPDEARPERVAPQREGPVASDSPQSATHPGTPQTHPQVEVTPHPENLRKKVKDEYGEFCYRQSFTTRSWESIQRDVRSQGWSTSNDPRTAQRKAKEYQQEHPELPPVPARKAGRPKSQE
jgi:hypothetical protein